MNKPDYSEALDIVETILGINGLHFAVATIEIASDHKRYLLIRRSIAKKIIEQLGFKQGTVVEKLSVDI
jgi:uncharacterized protein YqfA (UPF0365 family)